MLTKKKLRNNLKLTAATSPETGRPAWKFIGSVEGDPDFKTVFGYNETAKNHLLDPWKLEAMAAGVGLTDLGYANYVTDEEILTWLKSDKKRFRHVVTVMTQEKKEWYNWAHGLPSGEISPIKPPKPLGNIIVDPPEDEDEDEWKNWNNDDEDDEAA